MARAWRRPARFPRFRPRHRARPARAHDPAGARRSTGCRAASSSSPTPTSPMRGACSTRSASPTHFDELHDIHAMSLWPKPDPHGYAAAAASASASIPARALFVEDMARNLAPGQGARHDHGVGRQRLGTRRSRRRARLYRSTPSPTSATGSKTMLGEKWHDRPRCKRPSTPPGTGATALGADTTGEVRDAVEAAIRRARFAARRGSPRRSTANGWTSTNG